MVVYRAVDVGVASGDDAPSYVYDKVNANRTSVIPFLLGKDIAGQSFSASVSGALLFHDQKVFALPDYMSDDVRLNSCHQIAVGLASRVHPFAVLLALVPSAFTYHPAYRPNI